MLIEFDIGWLKIGPFHAWIIRDRREDLPARHRLRWGPDGKAFQIGRTIVMWDWTTDGTGARGGD